MPQPPSIFESLKGRLLDSLAQDSIGGDGLKSCGDADELLHGGVLQPSPVPTPHAEVSFRKLADDGVGLAA